MTVSKSKDQEAKDLAKQIKDYYKFTKTQDDELNEVLGDLWRMESCDQYSLSKLGLKSLRSMVERYDLEIVIDALKIAWDRTEVDPEEKIRYMGGICKNMVMDIKFKKEIAECDECDDRGDIRHGGNLTSHHVRD